MKNMHEVEGVTRTAREAAQCKASALGAGTASPLLNHVYFARAQLLHQAVACSIKALQQCQASVSESAEMPAAGATQLVLLGAGLDTSYDTWGEESLMPSTTSNSAYPATSPVRVFAVDYPTVIHKRLALPGAEDATCCVSANLLDAATMWAELQKAGLDLAAPMVIVTEMVCNYLPLVSVQALVGSLEDARRKISSASTITRKNDCLWISYDFYTLWTAAAGLESGFAAEMQHHFATRGAPLLHAQRTNTLQYARLGAYDSSCNKVAAHFSALWPCGYVRPIQSWINAGTLREIAVLPSTEPTDSSTSKSTSNAFFDEHASLALLHRHFGLSLYGSSQNSFRALLLLLGVTVRSSAVAGGNAEVKEAPIAQWAQVQEIYKKSFAEYAARHRTVAKFVALSLKHLQPVNSFCIAFACVNAASISPEQKLTMNQPQVHQMPVPPGTSGAIVGFVALKRSSTTQSNASTGADARYTLELSHMCVDSAFRGRGIGTSLLGAVFAHARQSDPAPQCIVLSVMTDLTAAMALYAKEGFCNDGPPVENGSCFLQKMVRSVG